MTGDDIIDGKPCDDDLERTMARLQEQAQRVKRDRDEAEARELLAWAEGLDEHIRARGALSTANRKLAAAMIEAAKVEAAAMVESRGGHRYRYRPVSAWAESREADDLERIQAAVYGRYTRRTGALRRRGS